VVAFAANVVVAFALSAILPKRSPLPEPTNG
jgi:hypothetical protein